MRVDLFSVCNWCVYILDERDDKDVLGVNSTAQSFSVEDTRTDDSYFNIYEIELSIASLFSVPIMSY